ncbi:hypothetical protein NGRA_1137 [Nosema granulosis]|uniref:Uncharacterized protein n=1 Tax=Nosema granulosis TaxID=83296 RepID=A0A9P6KYX4_9MICR|nr:hypothetical protein NGRA_1137 [Nosema granulosis]
MVRSILSCIFISEILCVETYQMTVGGLLTHYCGPKNLQENMHISRVAIERADKTLECSMTPGVFNVNEKKDSISAVVDYSAVKSMFFTELTNEPSSIVKLISHHTSFINENDSKIYESLLTLSEEDEFGFTGYKNSITVLKNLLGKTIINCTKGFPNGVEGLKEKLSKLRISERDINKFDFLAFFYSFFDLYRCCKSFFLNEKFDVNDIDNAFETFMMFFMNKVARKDHPISMEDLLKEDYIKALDCAKDFTKLCEFSKVFDKDVYNIIENYNYRDEDKVTVLKALVVKLPYRMYIPYFSHTIQLLDSKNNVVGDENLVKTTANHIIITFYTLSRNSIRYIMFNDGDVDVVIDISKFNPFLKEKNVVKDN